MAFWLGFMMGLKCFNVFFCGSGNYLRFFLPIGFCDISF